MSDDRLRALERRWLESGSADDQEAWLRARLRAGELSRARLRLLACLGHVVAARIEPAIEPDPFTVEGLDEYAFDCFCAWFRALDQVDLSARVAAVTPGGLYVAMRDELTRWVTGEQDPISARVQARLAGR